TRQLKQHSQNTDEKYFLATQSYEFSHSLRSKRTWITCWICTSCSNAHTPQRNTPLSEIADS
ncbi:TPA: hypothetical protein ACPY21_005046, partial [Escherichia coli]